METIATTDQYIDKVLLKSEMIKVSFEASTVKMIEWLKSLRKVAKFFLEDINMSLLKRKSYLFTSLKGDEFKFNIDRFSKFFERNKKELEKLKRVVEKNFFLADKDVLGVAKVEGGKFGFPFYSIVDLPKARAFYPAMLNLVSFLRGLRNEISEMVKLRNDIKNTLDEKVLTDLNELKLDIKNALMATKDMIEMLVVIKKGIGAFERYRALTTKVKRITKGILWAR